MSTIRLLLGLLLVASATDALAQRRGDARAPRELRRERRMPPPPEVIAPRRGGEAMVVREARREGRMLSARDIERRVVPTVRGAQYLGFDFDGAAVYTLKFLRDGNVIWVDVDARTGAVLGRTGR